MTALSPILLLRKSIRFWKLTEMSFNPGDLVAHKTRVLNIDTFGGSTFYSLEQRETNFLELSEGISYWIPIEEVTLLRSTFEDTKELIRYWVQIRDYIELREELSDQLDALAKKLGY